MKRSDLHTQITAEVVQARKAIRSVDAIGEKSYASGTLMGLIDGRTLIVEWRQCAGKLMLRLAEKCDHALRVYIDPTDVEKSKGYFDGLCAVRRIFMAHLVEPISMRPNGTQYRDWRVKAKGAHR